MPDKAIPTEAPQGQPGATPGAAPSSPSTPRGGRGPGTGGKKGRGPTTGGSWQRWWRHNRHPFVSLERHSTGLVRTGSSFLTGMGRQDVEQRIDRPTLVDVRDHILPVLEQALGSEDAMLLHEACLALGRVGAASAGDASDHASATGAAREQLRGVLDSRHADARHAAILGLGLLRDPAVTPILWGIMNDTRDARKMLGTKGKIQSYERVSAVLAFAMACRPAMQGPLVRFVGRQVRDDHELAGAGILALGHVRDAEPATVRFLLELLEDERVEWSLRAQAPIALLRLGEAAAPAVPALLQIMTSSSSSGANGVRQSCAIALGRLAGGADEEVVRGLSRLARRNNDSASRQFALIAMARIGARAQREAAAVPAGEEMELAPEVRRIEEFLLAELIDGRRAGDRPWSALACGLFGQALPVGHASRKRLSSELTDLLKRYRDPSSQGALALALGLLGEQEAGADLLERFGATRDPMLAGHLATALGLMKFRPAADPLLAAIEDDRSADLRSNIAVALGLLGDPRAEGRLLELLADSRNSVEGGSAAWALARLGRRSAVEPLTRLAGPDQGIVARRLALTALGRLAEPGPQPWHAGLAVDSNYLLPLSIQHEVLGMF